MLGIIGAMDVEVAEVKEAMQGVEVKTLSLIHISNTIFAISSTSPWFT